MKIGIIVHSQTGNTLSVARKLKEKLQEAGHSIKLEQVMASNDREPDVNKIRFTAVPEIDPYDILIFGAPVRGFALSPVMKAYLSKVESLQDKIVGCIITEFFPFPWMGGNQAAKQMKEICELKGAKISENGIVNWANFGRNKMITDTVARLSRMCEKVS